MKLTDERCTPIATLEIGSAFSNAGTTWRTELNVGDTTLQHVFIDGS